MNIITRLNSHLANMIAAGEVIEKPMSVVKELVENSIDAKATTIQIALEDSGVNSIKVTDNGCGMSSDDCCMAFMRHATSKIKNEYDLFRIKTLGFRGEAIPSIASVSTTQIITNDGTGGYQVTYKAGVLESKGVIASNQGTTVSVKNLFFNTPARLKYLGSLPRELSSISYLVERFAISNPNVSFQLTNNGNTIFHTAGNGDMVRLFGDLYGLNAAKNLIIDEYVGDGFKIKFVLVKPEVYRSTRTEITLIANNRYVKSNVITNAVIDGYYTNLPIGKYPVAAIYLDIDPLLVDVNVHPTKMQIKISNEEQICVILRDIISKKLCETIQIPIADIEENKPKTEYVKQSIFSLEENVKEDKPLEELHEQPNNFKTEEIQLKEEPIKYETRYVTKTEETSKPKSIQAKLPYMEYVGQVHGTYLIFQNEEGMYVLDQHACAERINYEHYRDVLGNENQPTTELLVPLVLEFTPQEMIFIGENIDTFLRLGFSLEQASPNSYFVRIIPAWAKLDNAEEIVLYCIKLMLSNREVSVTKFRDSISKQISCKASIRANKRISIEEVNALIEGLNKCENPYHCPHGRPTLIKITSLDLEKMFKRVV